jgi:hypothetical protein
MIQPSERFMRVEAAGIGVTVDLRVGHVRELAIEREGRVLRPLHTAPWVEDEVIGRDEAIAPNLRWLSGDFFCAPFAASDVEPAPAHGWPANSAWRHLGTERADAAVTARFELERAVSGARLEKVFTLRDGHPFLYQRHVFFGGRGRVPVANHAMVRFGPGGGRLAFSPKAWGETMATPQETDPARGRFVLAHPTRFGDLRSVATAAGGHADLTRYPIGSRHEDFAMLVEAPGRPLGWAAAERIDAGELFVSLKHPGELPVTMLWFSNGGRDYAPWNGRHEGVLGIEEGRSYAGYGHAASAADNPLARAGVPTALELEPHGSVSVRNVIGGLPVPAGWSGVVRVEARAGELALEDAGGRHVGAPCDADFLATV